MRVCGVVFFKGCVKGGSPFRWVMVYVHACGPRGGSFLAKISLVRPPMASGRSVLVLGSAGFGVGGMGLGILHFVGCFSGKALVGP